MNKFKVFTLLGFLSVVLLLVGLKGMQFSYMGAQFANMVPPPITVNSFVVAQDQWEEVLYAPGELEAYSGVVVSAQMGGNVEKISFTPGHEIDAGELIIVQDLSSEESQLTSAKSAEVLANKQIQRARPLLKSKDISQEDYDVFQARYDQALAQVKSVESLIAKKKIVAPFGGRLGISKVDVGQYLRAGDPIVTLQDISKLLVNFSVPQKENGNVEVGQRVRVSIDSGETQVIEGEITAISPQIDVKTRNIQVQAQIDNENGVFKPGMFVDVEVVVSEGNDVTIIPVSSVLNAPYGDSVYIIEHTEAEAFAVRQAFVRVGEARGDFVQVIEGLKVGEKIVSTGLFKLFNGQAVVEDNARAPEFKLDPQLKDS